MNNYFSVTTALTDEEFKAKKNVISMDKRVEKGSREYQKIFDLATGALDQKFGVAKHFVRSWDGKVETGNQCYNHIQELFVGNLDKIDKAVEGCTEYDFLSAALVPTIK